MSVFSGRYSRSTQAVAPPAFHSDTEELQKVPSAPGRCATTGTIQVVAASLPAKTAESVEALSTSDA